MSLNPVDVLLLLVILVGAWGGWRRGFLFAGIDLLTLVASLVAAFLGFRWSIDLLEQMFPPIGVWVGPLAFVGMFLLVHYVLGRIALAGVRQLPRQVHENLANRLFGLAPGVLNGCIHAVVVAVLLLVLPLGGAVGSWARDSTLANRFSAPAEWMEAQLAPIFDPAIQRSLQALTLPPESRRIMHLPTRVREAQVRPELEERLLEMVNAERAKAGIRPLQADPALAEVARAHSRDMFARAYFSHVTPDGYDLVDRMRRAKLGYLTAGENLAYAPTLSGAHQGLMNSPGHRSNILRPQFARVGIGIVDGGLHGLMVTQDFRN